MDIKQVAEGLQFPEGPIALSDGSIILTEIKRGVLSRITPDGRVEVFAETSGGPNGAAVGPDGAIYVTNNGGSFTWLEMGDLTVPGPTPPTHTGGYIQRVDFKTRKVTTLYSECEGRKLVGPNDIVFDKHGGMWFTDYGCTTPDGLKYGGLYYALADGSKIVRAVDHLLSPNGVGLSPDEKVVYVASSLLQRLWAFDVSTPGEITPPSPFQPGRIIHNLDGFQILDSLAVEASGKVCVATIFNGGITAFAPDGTTEHFPIPDLVTTNICFGGADMCDAWITASSTGKLYKCRWPRPGLKLNYNL